MFLAMIKYHQKVKHKENIWVRIAIHLQMKQKAFGAEMSSAKIFPSSYAAHTVHIVLYFNLILVISDTESRFTSEKDLSR